MITALTVAYDDVRLGRLLQLYIHEWSGLMPIVIGDDGLYPYPELATFVGPAHDAMLFVDGARPIGFALAVRDDAFVWHVEEFFIVAGERRRGHGITALDALTSRHPGKWTLTVRPENPLALAFWLRVLRSEPTPETGDDGIVRQRFTFAR